MVNSEQVKKQNEPYTLEQLRQEITAYLNANDNRTTKKRIDLAVDNIDESNRILGFLDHYLSAKGYGYFELNDILHIFNEEVAKKAL